MKWRDNGSIRPSIRTISSKKIILRGRPSARFACAWDLDGPQRADGRIKFSPGMPLAPDVRGRPPQTLRTPLARHVATSVLSPTPPRPTPHFPPNLTPAFWPGRSDLRTMKQQPPEGVSASPIGDDNLLVWGGTVFGPDDTPWEGGIFSLRMTFTEQYPDKPPRVRFTSEMVRALATSRGRSRRRAPGCIVPCVRPRFLPAASRMRRDPRIP